MRSKIFKPKPIGIRAAKHKESLPGQLHMFQEPEKLTPTINAEKRYPDVIAAVNESLAANPGLSAIVREYLK